MRVHHQAVHDIEVGPQRGPGEVRPVYIQSQHAVVVSQLELLCVLMVKELRHGIAAKHKVGAYIQGCAGVAPGLDLVFHQLLIFFRARERQVIDKADHDIFVQLGVSGGVNIVHVGVGAHLHLRINLSSHFPEALVKLGVALANVALTSIQHAGPAPVAPVPSLALVTLTAAIGIVFLGVNRQFGITGVAPVVNYLLMEGRI